MITKIKHCQCQRSNQHKRNEKGTQLSHRMFIQSNRKPNNRYIIDFSLMKLCLKLFIKEGLLFKRVNIMMEFVRVFICPDCKLDLVCHYSIVSEFDRFVETETVSDGFGFLYFELQDYFVKFENLQYVIVCVFLLLLLWDFLER